MNKLHALALGAATALVTFSASAAPGIDGSATVKGNKAGSVVVTGGKGSGAGIGPIKMGSVDLTAGANVNSIVVKGGQIGGTAAVTDNKVTSVVSTGGQANVNSILVTK